MSSKTDAPESNWENESFRRRLATHVPDSLRRNLTAKLIFLLVVGTLISGAVVVGSYAAINDEITDQINSQIKADTNLQATVYENWLSERWSKLNAIADAPEMQHESKTVLHQWLIAEQTHVTDKVQSLFVIDAGTGEVLGSTNTTHHGSNFYEAGLNKASTDRLIFISPEPFNLVAGTSEKTAIGVRAGDRLLVATVPTNISLVESETFAGATSSLYSLDGHRLLGTGNKDISELPRGVYNGTTVIDRGGDLVGMHVIAHDVLDSQPVSDYDAATSVGTVVVTHTPKTSAFAVRHQIARYLLLAFGLGIILLVVTSAVSMHSVTSDINRLSDRASRISEGSFDVDMTSNREDEIGLLYRSVGEMRDSLQKRLQQIESQRDNLDLLNQILRHDIRNDLNIITGHLNLLAEHVDDAGTESLETALKSTHHAIDLTQTARDMSEVLLQEGPDRQPVAFQGVTQRQLEEVRSAEPHASITIDGSIPDVTINANDMFDSVVRNLLKNAVQHNDKEIPEVVISATEQDDSVLLRVADNGPGVPDEQKDSIFGKGEKGLDSKGTGIGLYLVSTLVESYGGDVWVEDNEPEGAVFIVELPKAAPE